ncbi:MAG TPA: hypothetical protein PK177_00770 [Burkholderiaceae bacterium]|nr:hypothetical protein [Burkholderiaceae bacterium]
MKTARGTESFRHQARLACAVEVHQGARPRGPVIRQTILGADDDDRAFGAFEA